MVSLSRLTGRICGYGRSNAGSSGGRSSNGSGISTRREILGGECVLTSSKIQKPLLPSLKKKRCKGIVGSRPNGMLYVCSMYVIENFPDPGRTTKHH